MDGKNPRRSFLKGLLSVSVFSAASGLTFNRKTGAGFGEPGLIKKADAMNNAEYATGISDHEIKIEYFGMSCFLITTTEPESLQILSVPINRCFIPN
jgi:hypothetical protein